VIVHLVFQLFTAQMAERASSSVSGDTQTITLTEVVDARPAEEHRALTVELRKPKTDKQVKWTEGTVDNEHLNRKKSKCCCIYEKPRKFGESSSESEGEECENCFGHVEKKKDKQKKAQGDGSPVSPPASVNG